MKEAYLIDGVRTPIGSFRGSLSSIRTDDLAAIPIRELMAKFPQIPLDRVDDVLLGCANQAGEDNRNVARMALLLAGLPFDVPGETVNRLCSSGLSTAVQARRAIGVDEGDLFIAGGVEHMTRGPYVMSKTSRAFGNDSSLYDSSFGWRFVNPKMEKLYGTHSMGQTAENLAELYKITRSDQDAFAFGSQQKATRAREKGIFAEEISAVSIPRRKADPILFDEDEFIKPNTTTDILSKLRTAFKSAEEGGTVTAGNASGLNDGAVANLIASKRAVEQYDLQPKARLVSSAVVGVEPKIMGIGPVKASALALKRAGLELKQLDVIEINEAFAAQILACIREMGLDDNDPRINPNGGAIALGHPLGMTGGRLLLTAANQLKRSGGRYALVTMCVGVGQGYAAVIENVVS